MFYWLCLTIVFRNQDCSTRAVWFSAGASGVSAAGSRDDDVVDSRVHPHRSWRAYRGVPATNRAGKANGRTAATADRVQPLRRGFHGLISLIRIIHLPILVLVLCLAGARPPNRWRIDRRTESRPRYSYTRVFANGVPSSTATMSRRLLKKIAVRTPLIYTYTYRHTIHIYI